jgi:hypothetical protein
MRNNESPYGTNDFGFLICVLLAGEIILFLAALLR